MYLFMPLVNKYLWSVSKRELLRSALGWGLPPERTVPYGVLGKGRQDVIIVLGNTFIRQVWIKPRGWFQGHFEKAGYT